LETWGHVGRSAGTRAAGFDRWAVGNLVDNVNRGPYAEWLVGQALGIIREDDHRTVWVGVTSAPATSLNEIKASVLSQTWNLKQQSTPRFDIKPGMMAWDAGSDQWGNIGLCFLSDILGEDADGLNAQTSATGGTRE
jgi:hypothetical protein